MAKSKRSLVLILSLVMLVLALGSVLAVSGVFVRPATQVEAVETRAPGLYETGTTTLKQSWDDLTKFGGGITITTTGTTKSLRASTDLEGDLVCGKVSGLTSLNGAFYYCHGLTSITFTENFDTSNVIDMQNMFYNCSSLTSLDVSNFDTSNVTDMEGMFHFCSSLTSLDVSNFNTSKVTDMSSMFSSCSSLTSLDLSNFNTSNVKDMSSMFSSCSKLTSLDLSNFNTSKVTSMNVMFSGCSKLTSLNVSNFNTSNVTEMDHMFSGCSKLTSLDLSNFNTSKVTDMSSMFSACSLTTLDLSNFSTSSVIYMEYMFYECSSLTSLDVSSFNTSNVTDMSSMFFSCSKLTALDVSSFNTSSVTNMNYMFFWCSSLNTLDVSKFDTSNVTSMHWMFYGCTALKSLDVSKFDTSKVTNFTAMFGGTKLTVLDMAGFDFSAVKNISNTMGMLGINDTYCQAVLKQKSSDLLLAYQTAMQNQNISSALSSVSSDLATMYSNAIVEKTDEEIGYIGRVYVVGIVINEMFYSKNNIERALVDAQTLFDTKIGTIYAPASAISMNISLPYNVNYVYKANDGNTALPAQMLYGYNDIDSSLTELALFEGTLKDPAPKPSETEQTGVVADISMVVIALVSTIGLIVIATKKKRIAR